MKEFEGDGCAGHDWMARVISEEVRRVGSTKVTTQLRLRSQVM